MKEAGSWLALAFAKTIPTPASTNYDRFPNLAGVTILLEDSQEHAMLSFPARLVPELTDFSSLSVRFALFTEEP